MLVAGALIDEPLQSSVRNYFFEELGFFRAGKFLNVEKGIFESFRQEGGGFEQGCEGGEVIVVGEVSAREAYVCAREVGLKMITKLA